jgi:peptidyl-prolyl cis-trans isomerase SurA
MKFLSTLLLLCGLTAAHAAETQYIDSVIALVEDDVITNTELSREVDRIRKDFASKGRSLEATPALNRQVLELMIQQSILRQEAERRGISITDTQLNRTLQNMARKNQMNLSQFREALIANGIDYERFRQDVRNELAIARIKEGYASQNVNVSDQEVSDFLEHSTQATESAEFKLSHILIALPDGASSEQVAEANEKVHQLQQQLLSGADFADLAREYSSASTALQGGDLGWRKLAEIPSLFADVVPNLAVGEVSQPLRSASGFHLVKLDEKRDSERVITTQTHARHILIKEDELTDSNQAREKLEKIRQRILQGEDFAELAKQYSDDTGSAGLGGDLGWVGEGAMVPEFEAEMKQTPEGEISEVFQTNFGWHILEVLGHRNVDETEESKRAKIRTQLEEQKKQEVLELWQRRLRDQAFVKLFNA